MSIELEYALEHKNDPAGTQMTFSGGVVKLYIAEGKDIAIEFPV